MKKKIIISIIIVLVIICVFIFFFLFNKEKYMKISLDINPSIELYLNKDNIVKDIKSINNDGKDLISNDLIDKEINDVINKLTDNIIDKGYIDNDHVSILLYADKDIEKEEIINEFEKAFNDKDLRLDLIVIEEIKEEDKDLAKKYHISEAKANYLNNIKKNNENIDLNEIKDKSINELRETKETGKYCDSGYTLRGDFCERDKASHEARKSLVCPEGYVDNNNNCYKEGSSKETDKLICTSGFTLINNECINESIIEREPVYHCDKGELLRKGDVNPVGSKDNDKMYCVDKSTGKPPTLRCLRNPGHIMINGKCYNGPAPTIKGGCPNGDTLRGGKCYSLDNEDQYVCPSGNIYEKSKGTYVTLCPDTFTYINPTITGYKCPDGYTEQDKKCYRKEVVDPMREKICLEGKLIKDRGRCITDETTKMVDGYVCDNPNERLEGSKCIETERVPAKSK